MKLLLCRNCGDIFPLLKQHRECSCGETYGKYLDDLNAEYCGDHAVPLGFANSTFLKALREQPARGMGVEFTAFVIAKECKTMKKVKM